MAQTERLAGCHNPLGCEPDHPAHTDRYEGPGMASMGSTSEPQAGQWNIPSGRRRISGCPHSQACLPEAPGNAMICSRVSSIAVPRMQPHEPQRAPSPPKGCSSLAWQTGQTRKSDLDDKEEAFMFKSLSHSQKGNPRSRVRASAAAQPSRRNPPLQGRAAQLSMSPYLLYDGVVAASSLSSVLNRRLKPPLSSERLYGKSAQPVLAEVVET